MKRVSASLTITEMPINLHTHLDGYNQKDWQYQVLVRMWGNWSRQTTLVGMLVAVVTLENSLPVLEVINTVTIWPSNFISGCIRENRKVQCVQTQMFASALFIPAKKRRHPEYPSTNGWVDKKVLAPPDNGLLLGHRMEWNADTGFIMEEPGRHHAEWKEADTKDHMLYDPM